MVMAVLTALTGWYVSLAWQVQPDSDAAAARKLAEDMAIYRQAVIRFSTQYPQLTGSIANTGNGIDPGIKEFFPPMYSPQFQEKWRNYITEDGLIYIYPAQEQVTGLCDAIVSLSGNSVLAGFSAIDGTLHAPADIATSLAAGSSQDIPLPPDYHPVGNIPLPSAIPAGVVVWVAHRN
ncbi:MAG: type IV pilus biogenesis protein PilM [Undibacterium umbellatum]